jgi:kynureninase
VLELLDEDDDEYIYLCGRLLGTKTITRTRKTVEEMFSQLGGYAKQAWKSDLQQCRL